MRRFGWVLASVVLAVPWSEARANPWDLYGFNARAIAMGGAHTALANDFTAVHYNPAALTAAEHAGFGFGLTLAAPRLALDFDRADRSVAELEPPSAPGITFGTLFPLTGAGVEHRIALGLALNIPTRSLLDGQALDPAVPHWYLYQSLPRRLVATVGLGVMPWSWLSLGAGAQILAGLNGRLDYELDVVAGRFSRKTVTFDIVPTASPLLGVELRPARGWRIGVAYRGSVQSDVDLPVDLELTDVAELMVSASFQVQHMPAQWTAGVGLSIPEWALEVGLDVVYARWSQAPDPSVDSRVDLFGPLLDGAGLGDALDAPAPGQARRVDLGFRDVLTARLGVERRFGPAALRAGYAVRPSPAPLQTSGTNYVDTTSHQLSAGAGVTFLDPLGALKNPITVDLAGALHVLPTRRYDKIDPGDPVGGYDASGQIWVVSFALRYVFEEARTEAP